MPRRLLFLLLLSASLLHANTISYTRSFTMAQTAAYHQIGFDWFVPESRPADGTLARIDLSVDLDAWVKVFNANFSDQYPAVITPFAQLGSTVRLAGVSVDQQTTTGVGPAVTLPPRPSSNSFYTSSWTFETTHLLEATITDQALLNAMTGGGFEMLSIRSEYLGNNYTYFYDTITAGATGVATVTYTYAVPDSGETGSLLVMAGSLLLWVRGRQRRRAA